MNRLFTKSFAVGITLLFIVILSLPVFGQTINVTMRLNTATNRDTLRPHHVVQLRGEATGTVTPAVTWDQNTGIILKNIGGDYWETTFQMQAGATLKYKFWTGFNATTGTFFWSGWEGPINPANPVPSGDNRLFIAGNKDTTLALQFYNGAETKKDQYWRPYAAKPDTFAVYLRVNMGAFMETGDFNPDAGDQVVVRGSAPLDPTNTWNTLIPLTREAGSADNGAFFSGAGYIANNAVTAGTVQNFKFVYYKGTSPVWESTPNRFFTYSGAKDTTIHWVYFNNQKPTGGKIVSATLIWQMNTEGLQKLGLFDRNRGDRIVIDGAKAWDVANAIPMNYVPLLGLWVGQENFKKAPGAVLEYKAVLLWDASRVDPASPNYIRGLDLTVPLQYWEEPAVTGTGNRNYVYTDQTQQMIPGDLGFGYQFFNSLPKEGVIETPITVTFNVNMAPATNVATNPSNPLFRPGIDTVWVKFLDCLLPLTQGDGIYTNTPLMLEDKDGDLIYSGSLALKPPVPYDVAFRINYSTATGAIIQNGGGFQKGRSYYQFVRPTKVNADGTIVWPSQYSFPVLEWKDSNLTVEDPPDLFTPTNVADREKGTSLRTFALSQNYPNPFSRHGGPETTIEYQVAEKSHVRISVYNLMGQLVATLVDKQQVPGAYSMAWNGKDFKGNPVPSGIYFVKMVAGSFEQLRKMTLIR
ncbi:MAG: T9SS type A sorting domain-containing protein [candidate division KSB1 bacterium]|nr:T9SS type A sorting domain-containing protein [candidate division KSB1 bacterium]MDZ7301131.1 T9SS type A sorting domain-containing protein [candidate division KSB1 bacterium]MDZ7311985.1 T9SS type A sorting domain-containing protein [candidate division KSB1 bacterium]